MKFIPGKRYFSDDGHEFMVCSRTKRGLIRGYEGFALEANYTPRLDRKGREYITVKGRIFRAI